MNHPGKPIEDSRFLGDIQFRDQLINYTLILCTTLGTINFSISMIRAWQIGWVFRDAVFFIIVISILLVTYYRAKINFYAKAVIIIVACLLSAANGIYNLNMLAGAIFFLPLSSIIFSLIFSKRLVIAYGVFLIAFLWFMGAGFSSGHIHLKQSPSPEFLMTNYSHWLVYSLSFGLFFMIASMTILKYRGIHRELLMKSRIKNEKLEASNIELQKAFEEIKTLRGILPICSMCKRIRDDKGYWNRIEIYIKNHSDTEFSHGICEECATKHYPDFDIYED